MRSISGSTWGACKKSLLTVYRGSIWSDIDYSCIAIDSGSDSTKAKLDSIQYPALRIVTGAMKGTSLAALQVETGEPPLCLRREEAQIHFALKVKCEDEHAAKNVMTTDWKVNFGNFQPANTPLVTKVKEFFTKYADCEFEGPKLSEVPPWRIGRLTVDNKLSE